MRNVTVSTIAFDDAVQALIDRYCRHYGITGYVADPGPTWIGVHVDDRLVAAGAYTDLADKRVVRDWYVDASPASRRGSALLWRRFHDRNVPLYGIVNARNKVMLSFLAKRGTRVEGYLLSSVRGRVI